MKSVMRILQVAFLAAMLAFAACSAKSTSGHSDQNDEPKAHEESGHGDSGHGEGGGAVHWGYEGEGAPDNWSKLNADFALCAEGKAQSPIDVPASSLEAEPAEEITFDYKESPLVVVNNGHAIQVNIAPGSSMTVGGKTYELLQFHFHSPSENVVNGAALDAEAHLVHKAADGELAVIGVLYKIEEPNAALAPIWDAMPAEAGAKVEVEGKTINPSDLLPAGKSYYKWVGSLTTPPCSEGVQWRLMADVQPICKKQVAKFLEIVGKNARPAQPLNERALTLVGE